MGKQKKGRRVVSEATDLDTFNAQEALKQSNAKNQNPNQQAAASQLSQPQADFQRALDWVTDGELQHYFYLDNKKIEAICSVGNDFVFSNQQEVREALDEEILLFYIRQTVSELEYVLHLPFGKFWAMMTKSNKVMAYLDTFLANMRKVNDTHKLQIIALTWTRKSKSTSDPFTLSTMGQIEQSSCLDIREHVNVLLATVFAIFSRLSLNAESDENKFPLTQYLELVYNNMLFDVAKLYDIAAVYGPKNPEAVRKLIANVFENDLRFVQDFKESVDTIITLLKKCFNAALKATEMSNGDAVLNRTQEEQDDIIKRLLLDLSEILINIDLTTTYFPDSMLETVRNTSLPLFMGNVYSLMIGPVKKIWLKKSHNEHELEIIRKSLKKLAIESCLTILNVTLVKCIGVHTKNFAVVQNRIGQSLKQFIFGVTGNIELTKDSLHRNQNYLCENNGGQKFLKKLLNHQRGGEYSVDIVGAIHGLEDRFLDEQDKQMSLIILKSLARGQTVNLTKVVVGNQNAAPKTTKVSEAPTGFLSKQDKDNIQSILDMFQGQFTKQQVEQIYSQNNRNMEQTLDLFLSGQVTNQTEKIVVEVNQPQITINTLQNQFQKQEDLKSYVMEEYRDILFPRQLSKFAQKAILENQRALAQKQADEEDENKEVHKRIIELSNLMQYDDDAEESQVKVTIPLKNQQPIGQLQAKKVEAPKAAEQEEEDEEDLIDDVQLFIERQASDMQEARDYLVMDDAPKVKKSQQPASESTKKGDKNTQVGEESKQGQRGEKNQRQQNSRGGKDNQYRGGDGQRENNREQRNNRDNGGGYQKQFVRKNQTNDDDEQQPSDGTNRPESYRGERGGASRGGNNNKRAEREQEDPYSRPSNAPKVNNLQQSRPKADNEEDLYPRQQRGGRGRGEGGQRQRGGGNESNNRAGQRGSGRGGYRDDYVRQQIDNDTEYTTKNPLEINDHDPSDDEDQASNTQSQSQGGERGRGGRGRGRGNIQNRRGGAHNQKSGALRKQGMPQGSQPQM